MKKKKHPKRDFASMDPELQRKIAAKGGRIAHLHGAHKFTSEEARTAGIKGGKASWKSRKRKNK